MEVAFEGGGSSGDRLSALTDDLLSWILSLLPSRQAVQTSVLSKRWTDLWRSVPAINLGMEDFLEPDDTTEEGWRKMEDFTANLLMRHRASRLDAFRLDVSYCFGLDVSQDFHRWICRGIEYLPSMLEIKLPGDLVTTPHQLPNLRACRLKALHLRCVYLDQAFADQLHSGCPVLEDLVISNCRNEFSGIQSNSLKKLTVYDCSSTVADVLVIRAPYLAYLCQSFLHHTYENGALLDTGNSLVEASISLEPDVFSPVNEAMLLGSVFNVTTLKLEGFSAMAMLDKELDTFPIFNNLTTLSLTTCLIGDCEVHKFNALGRFLNRCPNLKKLTLVNFMVVPVLGPVQFPMLQSLTTLILVHCDLRDNFQLLRHCLQNSPILEKLTIRLCQREGKKW